MAPFELPDADSISTLWFYKSSLLIMIEHFLLISQRVEELIQEAASPDFNPPKVAVWKGAYHEVDAANFIYNSLSEEELSTLSRQDILFFLVVLHYTRTLNKKREYDLSEELFEELDPKYTLELQEEIMERHRDYLQTLGVAAVDWIW